MLRQGLENVSESPWIIAELIRRGHEPDEFKNYIFDQLRSAWDIRQKIGLLNLKLWLPELAKELGISIQLCLQQNACID